MNIRIKKFHLLIIILSFILINSETSAIEPNIFVQSTVNRASQTLSKDITKEQKMIELQKLAKDTVDIKGIRYYTLGKFRKQITDEQKKIFKII